MKNYFNNIFTSGFYSKTQNVWLFNKKEVFENIKQLDTINFFVSGGDIFDKNGILLWSWSVEINKKLSESLKNTIEYLNDSMWLNSYHYFSFNKKVIFSTKIDELLMDGVFSINHSNWLFPINDYNKFISLIEKQNNLYILGGDFYDFQKDLVWSFSTNLKNINKDSYNLESCSQTKKELDSNKAIFQFDIIHFSLSMMEKQS